MSQPIGGQAVLEGVMMRGPSAWSVAVRKPDGLIAEVNRPIASVLLRHRWLRIPIARGVVAVEPELSPAVHEALARGEPVQVEPRSIADGLSAPYAGEHVLALCRELRVESVLVSEDEIRAGFRFLYERAKLAAEPAGAVGVAAILARKIPDLAGRTVVAVVSGGNIASETAAAILSRK